MACNKCNEQTPAEIIDSISGSPSAVAGLCALLQPCITAAIGPDEPLDPAAIVNAIGNDGAALAGLCTYMQPCIAAAIPPGQDPEDIVDAIGGDATALAGLCAYLQPCITAAIGPGGTMDPAAIVNAIGNDVAALAGMCAYMKPCIDHFIDDKMVTYLEDVVVPGLPGAVALNPAGYELITDTFGVPLAYAFPV